MKAGLEAGFAEQVPVVDSNGTMSLAVNWVLSPDEFEQVRTGYRCLQCMEPLNPPFPHKCPLCEYEVKSRQTIDLMREHQGEHRYGPTPIEDIRAIDAERAERETPGWSQTGSGIVVPNTLGN